jgi:hypothetical protein
VPPECPSFRGTAVVPEDVTNDETWARAEGLPDAEASPDWAPVPFRPAADRVNPKKFYVLDAKGGQAFTRVDGGLTSPPRRRACPRSPTTSTAPPRRRRRPASKATSG